MKKGTIIWIAVAIVAVLLTVLFVTTHNSMALKARHTRDEARALESAYKARTEMVSGLINVVIPYSTHEARLFRDLIAARNKAGAIQFDPTNQESTEEYRKAQETLSKGCLRLASMDKSIPEMKEDQNFLTIQREVLAAEVNVEDQRVRYNEAVKVYNKSLKGFPNSIIASIKDFGPKYFLTKEVVAPQNTEKDAAGADSTSVE